MEKLRRHFGLAVLMSELGHVFCCVLPTIFTAFSFAANIGLIAVAPAWMMELHEDIHHYEVPIIIFSAAILLLGWGAYVLGNKLDCHHNGCGHAPCDPHKARNRLILSIATGLFIVNLGVYGVIHKNIFNLNFLPGGISAVTYQGHEN